MKKGKRYVEAAKAYPGHKSPKYHEKPDYDKFMNALSKIIKKGDVCIIMKICHWKLGYVSGNVTVITKDHVEHDSLKKRAREMVEDQGIDSGSVEMFL